MSLPIGRLLTRTVTYMVREGKDEYGDPQWDAQVSVAAYVEAKNDLVIATNGEETRSTHKIITIAEIPQDAQVWLPGDDLADHEKPRQILSTQYAQNPGGFQVWETWV